MTWEMRLAQLLLAGGTLAAVGCSDNPQSTQLTSPDATSPDATSPDAASPDDATSPDDASAVPEAAPQEPNQCCNASPDPCCPYKYCDASITVACVCELEGGTWDYMTNDSGGACEPGPDAGLVSDAGSNEDASDAGSVEDARADADAGD